MNDPMADIMSNDDAVDSLPDIGVMDLYVRAKIMRATMEKFSDRPGQWESDGFKEMENALMHYNKDGLRAQVAGVDSLVHPDVRRIACENRAEDFIVEMFDYMTNDDMGRDRKIEAARGRLKKHLSGSLGMPDDRVIRENLKNYEGDA